MTMQINSLTLWPVFAQKIKDKANIFVLMIILQQKVHQDIHICMTYILNGITIHLSRLLGRERRLSPISIA